MKTYLVWNVASLLSERVCGELALCDHRLLISGGDENQLALLDERLAQNELHRYTAEVAPESVSRWVADVHLGLDGCVAFAPLGSTLSDGWAAALLAALSPLLNQGKKPKRVLLVLEPPKPELKSTIPERVCSDSALAEQVLELARTFATRGLSLNAVHAKHVAVGNEDLNPRTDPRGSQQRPPPAPNAPNARRKPDSADLPGHPISLSEAARCCATLLDGLSASVTGQTLSLSL